MKKVMCLVTLAVVLLAMTMMLTGCGEKRTPSEGLEFTSNGDGTCYVSGIGTCTDADVVIPEMSPEGDSVTGISSYVFSETFEECTAITSVTIPASVINIDSAAFSKCSGLTSLTVDKKNPMYHSEANCVIETEKKILVAGCQNSVIPTDGSVTSIGEAAFYGHSQLTDIKIPVNVTSIEGFAFASCKGLTNVEIPDSVTNMEEFVFGWCENLVSVKLPSGIVTIGRGTFNGCTSLRDVEIPENVTNIGEHAFSGCQMESLRIPDHVINIDDNAFSGCSGLTSIEIPNSVTSIGDLVFSGCSGLTSIEIPDSVTSIGHAAFGGCDNLMSITVDEGNKVYHSAGNCLIETASKTLISGCMNSVIPTDGSVTSIGEYAFPGCSGLTSITIPDSVESIGDDAFYLCESLTSITFNGTMAQWKSITKPVNWDSFTGTYTIHCTDGDIPKSES